MPRKSIPKQLRFEVLKRDSFQCQYCGASAPDVLLHIDHVDPVSTGGSNDILNLITSCEPCNLGKGSRKLNDNSALVKQQSQLQDLQERREQLEQMIKWKEELTDLSDTLVKKVIDYWTRRAAGFSPTGTGRQTLSRLVKKYGYPDVIDAIDDSLDIYLKYDGEELITESVEIAFEKIAGILRTNKVAETKPYIRDLYYIRGILRNRVHVNESIVMEMLEDVIQAGMSIDTLKEHAVNCGSWTHFRDTLCDFIEN